MDCEIHLSETFCWILSSAFALWAITRLIRAVTKAYNIYNAWHGE